ncbi:MAG: carbohydrate ABC transporter permease [Blautia sp.]|nr:carbohydrate ABC transporter permease [Blautia sp.]
MGHTQNIHRKDPVQVFSIVILVLACVLIILPFLLMLMSSLTEENTLLVDGYRFFPAKLSLEAYEYIFKSSGMFLKSYGYSILVTAIGTIGSLFLTCTMAYPLSRPGFRFRGIFSFFVFFTMLFNGGLISQYMLWSTIFQIKNTILAYIVPNLLMSGFYVLIVRNYFAASIPNEVVESARMDGCGEWYAFWKIVLPMAKPILAAIGILTALNYWNDWTNGLYYITKTELYTFQNLLNRMIQQINFLSSGQASQVAKAVGRVPSVSVRMGIAVIGVLPILIMYPFFQKYFASGLTVGAVKG